MSKENTPIRLKKGEIIIALENIDIPGTGITFHIYKGKRYKLEEYLTKWKEHGWEIHLVGSLQFEDTGWFSEDELFKKFNCILYQRKEKLKKLAKISE